MHCAFRIVMVALALVVTGCYIPAGSDDAGSYVDYVDNQHDDNDNDNDNDPGSDDAGSDMGSDDDGTDPGSDDPGSDDNDLNTMTVTVTPHHSWGIDSGDTYEVYYRTDGDESYWFSSPAAVGEGNETVEFEINCESGTVYELNGFIDGYDLNSDWGAYMVGACNDGALNDDDAFKCVRATVECKIDGVKTETGFSDDSNDATCTC